MITFHETMDPHSLQIRRTRDDVETADIGDLNWHPGRVPCVRLNSANSTLTIWEMKQIVDKYMSMIQTKPAR